MADLNGGNGAGLEVRASLTATEIYDAWLALQTAEPPPRQRDAAAQIGVSEGALVQAKAAYGDAVALSLDEIDVFRACLAELSRAGEAMFLTRNPDCVNEAHGMLSAASPTSDDAAVQFIVSGDDRAAELSLDFHAIGTAFFVREATRSGIRHSVQLFNSAGCALLKIYKTLKSHPMRFDRIAELFDQAEPQRFHASGEPSVSSAPREESLDAAALEARWLASRDRSEIETLLSRTRTARPSAYRALDGSLSTRIDVDAAYRLLQGAATTGTVISIRTGNSGCTQTVSGAVRNVKRMGPWLNVLDPGFHLHLRESEIAEAWVVRAPTREGVLSWVDCLGVDGASVAQFFGRRPDGRWLCTQGPGCWRALLGDFVFQERVSGSGQVDYC